MLKLVFPTSKSTAALLNNTNTYLLCREIVVFFRLSIIQSPSIHCRHDEQFFIYFILFILFIFLLLQLILPLWYIKGCRTIWSCSWVVTNDVRIVTLPLESYAFLLLFRTFRFVRILCGVKGIYELHQYAILVFMNLYFGNMPWRYTSLLLHLQANASAFLELVNLKVHNVIIPLIYELHVSVPNRR